MSKVTINLETLVGIADAVRAKKGTAEQIPVANLASEIEGIQTSADPKLQDKTVTANGEVTPDEGYDGLSKVIVNIAAVLKKGIANSTLDSSVLVYTHSSSAVGTIE